MILLHTGLTGHVEASHIWLNPVGASAHQSPVEITALHKLSTGRTLHSVVFEYAFHGCLVGLNQPETRSVIAIPGTVGGKVWVTIFPIEFGPFRRQVAPCC